MDILALDSARQCVRWMLKIYAYSKPLIKDTTVNYYESPLSP